MSTACALVAMLLAAPLPTELNETKESPPDVLRAYLDDNGELLYQYPGRVQGVTPHSIALPDGSAVTYWDKVQVTMYMQRNYPLCRVCAYEATGKRIHEEQLRQRLKRSCKVIVTYGDRVLRPEVLEKAGPGVICI